jgi:hypothetical protein
MSIRLSSAPFALCWLQGVKALSHQLTRTRYWWPQQFFVKRCIFKTDMEYENNVIGGRKHQVEICGVQAQDEDRRNMSIFLL